MALLESTLCFVGFFTVLLPVDNPIGKILLAPQNTLITLKKKYHDLDSLQPLLKCLLFKG